jgi:1-acyl-sn-glycerol-3-phosphate acyltransferase
LGIARVPPSNIQKTFRLNPWAEIGSGLGRLYRDRTLWFTVLGIAYFWFLGALLQMDIILFGKAVMGLDDFRVGILGAFLAVGIGIGSLAAGRLSGDKVEPGLVPLGSIGMGGFLILLASAAASYTWTATALTLLGFSGGLFIVPLNALLQQRSGRDEKGRMIATANMFMAGGILLASGVLWASRDLLQIQPDRIILILGLFTLLATLYILSIVPDFLIRFSLWMFAHTLYRIRIVGQEHVPFRGPALLVCTPLSSVDDLLVGACVQRFIRFLIPRAAYETRGFQWLFRLMKAIPIGTRTPQEVAETLERAREELRQGHVVCIFTNGASGQDATLFDFATVFEQVVDGLEAPVIPVRLDRVKKGRTHIRKGRFSLGWFTLLSSPITVSFGRALPATASPQAVQQAILGFEGEAGVAPFVASGSAHPPALEGSEIPLRRISDQESSNLRDLAGNVRGHPRASQRAGYRLVRSFARLLLGVFYRRVEIVGIEHIPADGPIILAANHQNALVDPMLLLTTIPRQLIPIAKAPLFRHPLIAPFLHLAGALPVYRRQDEGSDPALNREMFRAAIATLRESGTILIFPEGVSQPEPMLMPLHTGAARMVLSAETADNGNLGIKLLPVGLVFHEPGTFRTGWALVVVGEAVPTGDCIALYRTSPTAAVRRLTDRLTEALRQRIVEANDRETLRLLNIVESLWREESGGMTRDAVARTERIQRMMRAYRYLLSREPARVEGFRHRVAQYAKDLELAGLTGRQLAQSYPASVVVRYMLRQGLSLVLGWPLALWGIANHLIPYQLTAGVVRRLRPSPDVEATYKIVAAVLLYPLCWAAEGWLAWQIGGRWPLGMFIASIVPTGFFALSWRERLDRFRREARGFFQFLMHRDLHARLLARRRELMNELTALAGLVPESALAGRVDEDR